MGPAGGAGQGESTPDLCGPAAAAQRAGSRSWEGQAGALAATLATAHDDPTARALSGELTAAGFTTTPNPGAHTDPAGVSPPPAQVSLIATVTGAIGSGFHAVVAFFSGPAAQNPAPPSPQAVPSQPTVAAPPSDPAGQCATAGSTPDSTSGDTAAAAAGNRADTTTASPTGPGGNTGGAPVPAGSNAERAPTLNGTNGGLGTPSPATRPAQPTATQPAAAQPAAAQPTAGGGNPPWDTIAACESTGNWATNTGTGYYGGLQFDLATWRAFDGAQYAPTPDKATKAQQVAVAVKVRDARGGYGSWPVCSQKAGL